MKVKVKKVLIQESYRTSVRQRKRENSICLQGVSEINSSITHLPTLRQHLLPEMDPGLASLDLVPSRIDALVGQDHDDDRDHGQYDKHQVHSDYIGNKRVSDPVPQER